MSEHRHYFRHPGDIPIQIFPEIGDSRDCVAGANLSEGGLAFRTNVCFMEGTCLRVAIPHIRPPFESICQVCWHRPVDDTFEIGVRFLDGESVFRARMVEQVCYIEHYRNQAKREGRELTADEASREWIQLSAEAFKGTEFE